jgi:hypothetical protein
MNELTRILDAIRQGDAGAAAQLLPLVYDELRRLAAQRLAQEKPGQTLQPTALVHEAYLRLVGPGEERHWDSRGHFFAAAAEAMRRILVEQARRKQRVRHGGGRKRIDLGEAADSDDTWRRSINRLRKSNCVSSAIPKNHRRSHRMGRNGCEPFPKAATCCHFVPQIRYVCFNRFNSFLAHQGRTGQPLPRAENRERGQAEPW